MYRSGRRSAIRKSIKNSVPDYSKDLTGRAHRFPLGYKRITTCLHPASHYQGLRLSGLSTPISFDWWLYRGKSSPLYFPMPTRGTPNFLILSRQLPEFRFYSHDSAGHKEYHCQKISTICSVPGYGDYASGKQDEHKTESEKGFFLFWFHECEDRNLIQKINYQSKGYDQ